MDVRTTLLGLGLFVLAQPRAFAQDARQSYENLYGKEARAVAASAGKDDDGAFARKLLADAGRLADDPKLQVLLWEKAHEFGRTGPGGYDAAGEALDALAVAVPQREAECRQKKLALYQLASRKGTPAQRRAAGEAMVDLLTAEADTLVADGKYDEALAAYRRASYLATRYAPSSRAALAEKLKQLGRRQAAARRVEAIETSLKLRPNDPALSRRLAMAYVVELDAPAKAATAAAASGDETLRTYVPMAAKPLEELPAGICLELASWYRKLAAGALSHCKPAMLLRARAYCGRFLALHDKQDTKAIQASRMLAELRQALADLGVDAGTSDASTDWVPTRLRQLHVFACKSAPKDARFSGDARYLAALANKETPSPLCWDLRTGKEALKLRRPVGQTMAYCFSPSSQQLVTGHRDGWRLWDLKTGRLLGGREGDVEGVLFSPNGRLVVILDKSSLQLWDARKKRLLRRTNHPTDERWQHLVAFLPNGRSVVLYNGRNTACWHAESGRLAWQAGQSSRHKHVFLSPGGRYVVGNGMDLAPVVVDARTGKELWRLDPEQKVRGWRVFFPPDGRQVAMELRDGVTFFDLAAGKKLRTVKPGMPLYGLLGSGKTLFMEKSCCLHFFNVLEGRETGKIDLDVQARPAALSPNQRMLACCGTAADEGKLYVYEMTK